MFVSSWDKNGVKRFIDDHSKIRIPWKQIVSGEPWIEDIEIKPYHIEKTWIPQNLLPFKASNSDFVSLR